MLAKVLGLANENRLKKGFMLVKSLISTKHHVHEVFKERNYSSYQVIV